MMESNLKVLFVSAEVVPFAKTGGLADVSMALPKALSRAGNDVRIVMPCYKSINRQKYKLDYLTDFPLKMNNFTHSCIVRENAIEYKPDKKRGRAKSSLPVYFIDSYEYFDRDGLYSSESGDYIDNARRFGYFCRGVLELIKKIGFKPDVIHINDWQAALLALLLKHQYGQDDFYKNIATLFTIHNLQYQGVFDMQSLIDLDLTWEYYSPEYLEYYGKINLMKAGIIFSDLISTVSQKYASEIQEPPLGMGLNGLLSLRRDDLYAVTNGVDYDEWNPETDTHIAENYGIKNYENKKDKCKKDLQKIAGLPETDTPVIGMVTRLADQKGLDILAHAMDEIMKMDVQLAVLGTGEQRYMDMFSHFSAKYPQKCASFLKFDALTATKIYAGSDFFLIPSRFEPCGTGQLISMKFGTIPIVRATGGLADTVSDFDPRTGHGNGFSFEEYSSEALINCIKHALSMYQNRREWDIIVKNAMNSNFSWEAAAQKYTDIYRTAIKKANNE